MDIHGYLNDIHGNPYLSVDVHGCRWISMVICGCPWLSMDINGYPWISMDIHLYSRISTDIHSYPCDDFVAVFCLSICLLVLACFWQNLVDQGWDGGRQSCTKNGHLKSENQAFKKPQNTDISWWRTEPQATQTSGFSMNVLVGWFLCWSMHWDCFSFELLADRRKRFSKSAQQWSLKMKALICDMGRTKTAPSRGQLGRLEGPLEFQEGPEKRSEIDLSIKSQRVHSRHQRIHSHHCKHAYSVSHRHKQ